MCSIIFVISSILIVYCRRLFTTPKETIHKPLELYTLKQKERENIPSKNHKLILFSSFLFSKTVTQLLHLLHQQQIIKTKLYRPTKKPNESYWISMKWMESRSIPPTEDSYSHCWYYSSFSLHFLQDPFEYMFLHIKLLLLHI